MFRGEGVEAPSSFPGLDNSTVLGSVFITIEVCTLIPPRRRIKSLRTSEMLIFLFLGFLITSSRSAV